VNIADRDNATPLSHVRRRGFSAMAWVLKAAGGR